LAFAVGDVVAGRYEVLENLGQRPLGMLYRAREREIGVEVALWVIGAQLLPDETQRQTFAGKVQRAKSFSHPNLVRVFGVYPTADEVVIAAQSAPGQTLFARVAERTFTPEEARPVLAQVASAMTHAHQHGVILGDVWTTTVVLLGAQVKLSNVGLAAALPRKRFLEAVRESPGYQRMPPELRSGMTLDARADVYSLAMLTVEMLTGGVDRNAVAGPEPLKAVLARALTDDPMVRHTSVEALLHELDAGLVGRVPAPRRPTPPVGIPITRDKIEDVTGPVPKPDEVHMPETTRSIDPEELELLKGDQVTRQVPLEEILPYRAASSETQQVPLEDMLVEDSVDQSYDELKLESPPPVDDLKTEQVHRLEPDAAKTTEHPRLPPPINEDEIDTAKVTRADVREIVAAEESPEERIEPHDPNATPLPPPMPQSSTIPTPAAMTTPREALADSKDVPTSVESPQAHAKAADNKTTSDKIEISVELPIIDVVPPPPKAPRKDEALYDADDENAPTRTVDAGPPSLNTPPTPPPPALVPAPTNVPTPIAASPSGRRKRNPFDPLAPEDEALTTEHKSPPPRPQDLPKPTPKPKKKRNPFDAAPAATAAPGAATLNGKRKKKGPQPTQLVSPLSKRGSGVGQILLVALAAFIAAVGVALAVSHYLTEQRLEEERRAKQKLADELNAQAEALRKKQAMHPDAGAAAAKTPPVVTHPEPTPTLLPRQGACPLGAHLVTSGGRAFCVDVYEYPGGNTIPRTNVSFSEAGRICAARGERLCTEGEWERACRGKGNASYPYGQAFDATRCNTKGTGGELAPSGAFAACKSGAGAYDMSGNVAEWVATGAQKGGTAQQGARESRCSATTRTAPQTGGPLVGFRCCADPTGKR
jgi:eukaryotic-like serine/threonine-protein kinase